MKEVAVSFLKEGSYKDYIKQINNTNADYVHFDVMDGKFVEKKNMTISQLVELVETSTKKNDIHLMVQNPEKYIEKLSLMNINNIAVHYEIKNVEKYLKQIKSYGIKSSLAINPDTDIEKIRPYLKDINIVLVMSVIPGKSGQTFIDSVENKINSLRSIIEEEGLNIKIEVDGGVCDKVLEKTKNADILVSASYLLDDLSRIDILKNS